MTRNRRGSVKGYGLGSGWWGTCHLHGGSLGLCPNLLQLFSLAGTEGRVKGARRDHGVQRQALPPLELLSLLCSHADDKPTVVRLAVLAVALVVGM